MNVWEMTMVNKDKKITLTFSSDYDIEDISTFRVFYDSMKLQIKDQLFKKK